MEAYKSACDVDIDLASAPYDISALCHVSTTSSVIILYDPRAACNHCPCQGSCAWGIIRVNHVTSGGQRSHDNVLVPIDEGVDNMLMSARVVEI